jgi:hypothetical protein
VDIEVQKESSRCNGCGENFVNEQKHYSLLRIEESNFTREDYCEKCWAERPTVTETAYSFWETRYRDPAMAKAMPEEQFMPLLKLCYESIVLGGRDSEAIAYVCALVLRRQKIFRFVREEKDPSGRGILVFTDKYNDAQIRVVDPQLTEAELRGVRQKLEEHMGYARGQVDER